MAKKPSPAEPSGNVTPDRVRRLVRLLRLLGRGPQLRSTLIRQLRIGVRGFYRDLEALRAVGIDVELTKGRYRLLGSPALALELLPFPDPGLTVGEARVLARGRSAGHKKVLQHLQAIER